MTVEADIISALSGLVAGRVFPDIAPQNAARPCITYQQVGGQPVNFLERATASKKNGRFQINTIATSRAAAASLALDIESSLVATTSMQASALTGPVATHEPVTNIYGTRQDFSIWSDR